MSKPTNYTFAEPTQDHGYLAQLQEWANHYHVTLGWRDDTSQRNGISSTTSYPISKFLSQVEPPELIDPMFIVKGHPYPAFSGTGPKVRLAQGKAAEKLIKSPATL